MGMKGTILLSYQEQNELCLSIYFVRTKTHSRLFIVIGWVEEAINIEWGENEWNWIY